MLIKEMRTALNSRNDGSAWNKGVTQYALELIEELETNYDFTGSPADRKTLLNGADSWTQYSDGGCSLIYDGDIAERLCSPSELKKNKNGERRPNAHEEWLDVQARALHQAERRLLTMARKEWL